MEEVAEELEKMEYHPEMGDLIAGQTATQTPSISSVLSLTGATWVQQGMNFLKI